LDSESEYVCSETEEIAQCDHLEDGGLSCLVKEAVIGSAPSVAISDVWEKPNLSFGELPDSRNLLAKLFRLGPKHKEVSRGFSVKKRTESEMYSIEPGETQFFKMTISFPRGSSGEFYIEAIGRSAYGLLDPWWSASWDYERPVSITYSGSSLSDYQLPIYIDTQSLISAGKLQSDCDDIRFSDSNRWADNNELSYYLEPGTCNRSNTKVWVKIPSLSGNKTIYFYYGNTAAVSGSSGSNTFVFFDDFESNIPFSFGALTLYRSQREAKNGSYGLEGVSSNVRRIKVVDNNISGRNLIWETWAREQSSSTAAMSGIIIGHPDGGSNTYGYVGFFDGRTGSNPRLAIRRNYSTTIATDSSYTPSIGTWHFLQMTWRSDGYLQLSIFANATSTSALASCSVTDTTYDSGEFGVADNRYASWDEYRVRKLATSTATTTVGSEVQITNHSPAMPSGLLQMKGDGYSTIPNTYFTNDAAVNFYATSSDKDGQDVTLYYQVIASSSSFLTATSTPASPCNTNTSFNSCSSKVWKS